MRIQNSILFVCCVGWCVLCIIIRFINHLFANSRSYARALHTYVIVAVIFPFFALCIYFLFIVFMCIVRSNPWLWAFPFFIVDFFIVSLLDVMCITVHTHNVIILWAHTICVVFVLSCVILSLVFSHLRLHLHNKSMAAPPPPSFWYVWQFSLSPLHLYTYLSLSFYFLSFSGFLPVRMNWACHFKEWIHKGVHTIRQVTTSYTFLVFSNFSKDFPGFFNMV